MSSISIEYSSQFGSGGTGNGEFNYPSYSLIYNDELYVVDKQNHRIQVFTLLGAYVRQFGSVGSGNDNFFFPEGIAINPVDGYLVIVDGGNSRVKVHQTDGTFISEFGSYGTGNSNFAYPVSLFVNNSYIYIADKQNSRIVIYKSTDYNYHSKFGTYGAGDSNLNFPESVTVLDTYIVVADSGNNEVKFFTLSGTYSSKLSETFNYPVDVSIVDSNYLSVIDKTNCKILIFDETGVLLEEFGSAGSGSTNMYFPISSVYSDNQQFVVDSGNNRVLILDLDLDLEVPIYAALITKLAKQLYPTGRAWWIPHNGTFYKLNEALAYSESRALSAADSILDSILPDNDNFDTTDAYNWENSLGLITNTSISLEDRKLAITRKMKFPGEIKARQHYLYLEGQLREAGFDVYVHENRFDDGAGGFIPYSPIPTHGTFMHNERNHNDAADLTYTKLVNNIDELKDESFNLGDLTDLKCSFYVGGATFSNSANVDILRKTEFRELILKIKPANTYGILIINYV